MTYPSELHDISHTMTFWFCNVKNPTILYQQKHKQVDFCLLERLTKEPHAYIKDTWEY